MELPENLETKNFDLLIPISTEGTIKNRRNVIVSSFIVSSIYLLDKSILDLNVFGLKLQGANASTAVGLALLLILFWLAMYVLHGSKDAELNRERRFLLNQHLDKYKVWLDEVSVRMEKYDEEHPSKKNYYEYERKYQVYTDQVARTKGARLLSFVVFLLEYSLPFVLAIAACYFLLKDFLSLS